MLRCMIVEIHAVTLFNSRNSNILHAAVASTFSLQANSSRVEEALRPTDSLRQHQSLLALRPRETDVFAATQLLTNPVISFWSKSVN